MKLTDEKSYPLFKAGWEQCLIAVFMNAHPPKGEVIPMPSVEDAFERWFENERAKAAGARESGESV